jgi:hypothetical protein
MWEQDMLHGKGIFYYSDGSVFAGQFDSNKRHGQGAVAWNHPLHSNMAIVFHSVSLLLPSVIHLLHLLPSSCFHHVFPSHTQRLGCFTSTDGNT